MGDSRALIVISAGAAALVMAMLAGMAVMLATAGKEEPAAPPPVPAAGNCDDALRAVLQARPPGGQQEVNAQTLNLSAIPSSTIAPPRVKRPGFCQQQNTID